MNPTVMGVTYGPERLFLNFQHCQAAEEAHWRNAEKANLPNETYAASAARLEQSVADAEEKVDLDIACEREGC